MEKVTVAEEVSADLAELETQLAASNPGVLDVLHVYGGYEEAVRQLNQYLSVVNPLTVVTTSNSSAF